MVKIKGFALVCFVFVVFTLVLWSPGLRFFPVRHKQLQLCVACVSRCVDIEAKRPISLGEAGTSGSSNWPAFAQPAERGFFPLSQQLGGLCMLPHSVAVLQPSFTSPRSGDAWGVKGGPGGGKRAWGERQEGSRCHGGGCPAPQPGGWQPGGKLALGADTCVVWLLARGSEQLDWI